MVDKNDSFAVISKLLTNTEIPIGDKKYKLRYSLTDLIGLEKEGFKISLISELLKNEPMLAAAKILYAGFLDDDKKEMSYENFCDSITVDILLNFIKNLGDNVSTIKTALSESLPVEKKEDKESKDVEKKSSILKTLSEF